MLPSTIFVMRLLQMSGILNSSHSFYKLSGLNEGKEIEQLNLVSRIKYAAQQGDKTVVMSQVEEVSECFYDLFNQHFKEFKKDGKTLYFANIALGGISRPCLVSPSFQCIVHVQSNQLDDIPAPFLHRFETYIIGVDDILSWQLSKLPRGVSAMLCFALNQCEEFLNQLGNKSIWSSSQNDTLKSLFISMIPPNIDSCSDPYNVDAEPTISSIAMCFLKRWFITSVTIVEIQQAIETAISNMNGIEAIELRKVLVREGHLDSSQWEQALKELANGGQHSPLLRSLESVLRYTILRHVIHQLLMIAMPESVFLQR